MSKVIVVTDYTGNLHITPESNKNYYKSRNTIIKDKQFVFRDFESEEAAATFVKDNNGTDPDFITPSKASAIIADKDAENATLKQQLADLQKQLDAKNNAAPKADEVIAQIVAATTVEDVNKLVEGETRKTVLEAATKKLADLQKQ